MLDVDTFLTILYVMVDDLCHCRRPKRRPGPKASLSESEVITLAIFARWGRFASEGFRGRREPPQVAQRVRSSRHPSAPTQLPKEKLAQTLEAVGRFHPPARGNGLRQAV